MNYYKKKTSIYMKIHIKYVLYYLNAFHTIFNSSMRGPFSSTESLPTCIVQYPNKFQFFNIQIMNAVYICISNQLSS